MEKAIELGIGFVTGRANVCKIINNYFKDMIRQIRELETPVNITLFVLYDLTYRGVERLDFYKIIPEVYKDGYLIGHTGNYLLIKCLGDANLLHQNINVKLETINYPYIMGNLNY